MNEFSTAAQAATQRLSSRSMTASIRGRKKIQATRKKIVDSAPLRLYVQITLPNCEFGDAPDIGSEPVLADAALSDMRSTLMAAPDKARRLVARRLYEHDHFTVSAIAQECGVSRATVTRWIKADQWVRQTPQDEPNEPPLDRRALVTRAWRNAERQLRHVEKRMRLKGSVDLPLDENARLIATLVKTLRELAALDRALAEEKESHGGSAQARIASEPPRDLDAFYEELAARMDRLRQDRDSHGTLGRPAAEPD